MDKEVTEVRADLNHPRILDVHPGYRFLLFYPQQDRNAEPSPITEDVFY